MAPLNFNTTNSTFRQLLGNGLVYRVPPFQRDYSWTEDEWDDLWLDMLALFQPDGEAAHYMGYLVLQSADSKQFDIIDGQQRITTISVMILAALSYLGDLVEKGIDADKNAMRKTQLMNSYIGYLDPVTLVSSPKLSLNRHTDSFYKTYLAALERLPQRGLSASEHLLRKAFLWFREKLGARFGYRDQSGTDLAVFIDGLVDKLFFTVITVTDELNAFKVFETLNARGVRLSATDLLKNYLFSVVSQPGMHENELRSLEERWEKIVGVLRSEEFPEFLRTYWNSRHRLVRKSDLFKTIRKEITSRKDVFDLVRDMDQAAGIYASLLDYGDDIWSKPEKTALQQLTMFSVRQPMAMLLSAHQAFFDGDRETFDKILRAVTILSFRYNVICNLPPQEQEKLYNDIARSIADGTCDSAAKVLAALGKMYPDDPRFKAAFSDKSFKTTNARNKKIVRYILFEIEKQRSGTEFDFESSKYSIEHILPENPSESWSYIVEEKQDALLYRLGNMTPLETAFNKDVNNFDFAAKRQVYPGSVFQITRSVAEKYDRWDEDVITQRQANMANVATGIWKIDFGFRACF